MEEFFFIVFASRGYASISWAFLSGRDVTELYMAINSPRSPWQCLKSA